MNEVIKAETNRLIEAVHTRELRCSTLDYNETLGRPGLNAFRTVTSTCHLRMKFPTPLRLGTLIGDQRQARGCCWMFTIRGSKSRLHSHPRKGFGGPKRIGRVIEQCESPIETPGQSGKHAFVPGVGNKAEGKIMETEEGASSCSLVFLKEWVRKSVGPPKNGSYHRG